MHDKDKYDFLGNRIPNRNTKDVSFETGRESRRRIRKEQRKLKSFR